MYHRVNHRPIQITDSGLSDLGLLAELGFVSNGYALIVILSDLDDRVMKEYRLPSANPAEASISAWPDRLPEPACYPPNVR